MGGIKEGFTKGVTCWMGFDGGVEAYQGGKKSTTVFRNREMQPWPPKSCEYQFHMQAWAPDPAQNPFLSFMAYMWYVEQRELEIYSILKYSLSEKK